MVASKIQKIVERVPPNVLIPDLERFRQEAIRLGATDAKVIPASDVIIDERVHMKCLYPKCTFYGTSANCPPHAVKPEQMREVVKRFHYGLLVTLQTPPETVVGDVAARRPARLKLAEIVARLEAMAFYDGYYLALGFAGGGCKDIFCPNEECSALKPGQACRAPLRARSSMEAVGMDAYLMATRAGWDIYPCGRALKLEDVPFGRRVGLVLIY